MFTSYRHFVLAGERDVRMATLSEEAARLLDFNQKLDITLLDNIVGAMYSGIGDQVSENIILSL